MLLHTGLDYLHTPGRSTSLASAQMPSMRCTSCWSAELFVAAQTACAPYPETQDSHAQDVYVVRPALQCGVQVKLLMVGSARRLRAGVPLLAQLLDWVEGQGRVMQLPTDALAG
mgnify:CR=1 FL=1